MNNFFDFIKEFPSIKRLRVNELLLVEYHCPIDESQFDIWSHHNYFVYVIHGKKKWKTLNQEVEIHEGDCLFVRKGAHSVIPNTATTPCVLMLFIPDDFIRAVVMEYRMELSPGDFDGQKALFSMNADDKLRAYFHSFFTYLSTPDPPEDQLLELKFRGLIMMIASGSYNKTLKGYFAGLCQENKPSLRDVMEANYTYPMSLEEYARLSGRSLSTFKRDFKKVYGTTPGRWLTRKRLNQTKYLLEHTGKSVSEVTGADLIPAWIGRAKKRAEADGVNASFYVADAQNLPFQDEEFDMVMSVLGVIFAPNQKKAASELLRVCKPGGKIGLMSHAKGGVVDEMFAAMESYMPPPPPGLESPIRWGTEKGINELLGEGTSSIENKHLELYIYARTVEHQVDLFHKYYGPTVNLFNNVLVDRQDELRGVMVDLLEKYKKADDGSMVLKIEYQQTIAVRKSKSEKVKYYILTIIPLLFTGFFCK